MSLKSLLRQRIDIEQGVYAVDAKGARTVTWSVIVSNIRADIQPVSTRQRIEALKVGYEITHRVYCETKVPPVGFATKLHEVIKGTQAAQNPRARVKFHDSGSGVRYFEIEGVYDTVSLERLTVIECREVDDAHWNV